MLSLIFRLGLDKIDHLGAEYDHCSVMHYPEYAFTKVRCLHPDARAVGLHTKNFTNLDIYTKKGPPNRFLQGLLLLKWISGINSDPFQK